MGDGQKEVLLSYKKENNLGKGYQDYVAFQKKNDKWVQINGYKGKAFDEEGKKMTPQGSVLIYQGLIYKLTGKEGKKTFVNLTSQRGYEKHQQGIYTRESLIN